MGGGLSVTEWEVGNLLLFIIMSLQMELGMPMVEFLEIDFLAIFGFIL